MAEDEKVQKDLSDEEEGLFTDDYWVLNLKVDSLITLLMKKGIMTKEEFIDEVFINIDKRIRDEFIKKIRRLFLDDTKYY